MIIRAGYNIAFECPSEMSMLAELNVHPSVASRLLSPDIVRTDPVCPTEGYLDVFGNLVTRISAPAGLITFYNDFRIEDSGLPDETPYDAPLAPVSALPSETLVFLLSSRYCDSDILSDFAWSKFGALTGGASRVRAICDFVHGHIRFDYQLADAKRTASGGMREGVGVCRDFAHLAIALCRCMNIPARYCTGYLGDIGVPIDPNPMDFSAWFEVFLNDRWYTMDARHNHPRIGRILMARGRDAADAAISTSFGPSKLVRFEVHTVEEVSSRAAVG